MAKMGPRTKRAFDFFVAHANRGGLHPFDWDRFYRFVRTARRYRSQIWEQDVKQALVEAGFGEDHARELSIVYSHCWRMIAYRSPMEAKEDRFKMSEERRLNEEFHRQTEGHSFRSSTRKGRMSEIKELRRQFDEDYRRQRDEELLRQLDWGNRRT